jgi:exosome complex exonuclease DIS3/RRP44
MWSSDVSERKISRRLRLIKRVRERYTREDIPCGFLCCESPCKINMDLPVFVIPTAEVILRYKALLKSNYVAAIICQSVLEELPRGEERKLRQLVHEKGYIVFLNNFCRMTSGKGLEGVLEFYRSHLPQYDFALLSTENIGKYNEYIRDDIRDLISAVEMKGEVEYEEYWGNLEALWSSGKILRGYLQVSPYNCYSGHVLDGEKRIKVIGKQNMNRAIHGDEVFVNIVEERRSDELLAEENVVALKTREIDVDKGEIFGKIIGISKRKGRRIIGTISSESVPGTGPQNVLVLPVDRRIPSIRIRTSQVEELLNRRLEVEIDLWDRTSNYPSGHYYRRLGEVGDRESEIESILISQGIDYFRDDWVKVLGNEVQEKDFSMEQVYEEARNGTREDLRELEVMSIDPPGCTDIDDALHCRRLKNGNYEIGVHIADVAHFVKKDSLLDRIALDRGTTVYLPDRRIDMLPPFLSSGLCSLLENEDRAAFSVIWEMTPDANVVKTFFCKSLIRSRKAFTYEEADKAIKRGGSQASVDALAKLNEISRILRCRRLDAGALELSSRELQVKSNGFEFKDPLQTTLLVEEYMLLANISAASFTFDRYPDTSLLRKHPFPSAFALALDIDTSSSRTINEGLAKLSEDKKAIARRTIARAMNQAVYFISGTSSDFYHYGLATPIYTHFTSPIRRYADIVVHRILSRILASPCTPCSLPGLGQVSYRTREGGGERACSDIFVTEEAVSNLNSRHRGAQRASWDCTKLLTYLILREKEPIADAYVVSVMSNGMVVYIPEYNLEEAIYFEEDCSYEAFQSLKVKIFKDDEKFFFRRKFAVEIQRV